MALATASTRNTPKADFWAQPLGYGHASLVAVAVFLTGVGMHFAFGYKGQATTLAMGLIGIPTVLGSFLVGRVLRLDRVVHWFTGIPFAVVSTAAVGLVGLVGGFIPKAVLAQRLHVESLWSTWPFLLLVLLMMVNLVGSCGKRCWPLTYNNVVYLSSHLGLALAIAGGAISAATLERSSVSASLGRPTAEAEDVNGQRVQLPFQVKLRKFELESFDPTLAVATLNPAVKDGMQVAPGPSFVAKGMKEQIGELKVEVLDYIPKAVFVQNRWTSAAWSTAAPAAFVRVASERGKQEGWVSSGSVDVDHALIKLSEGQALVMPKPRPKKFRSEVDIIRNGKALRAQIEVNKPLRIDGYDIYQLSYDDAAGAATNYSVLEVVKDRGLGVVYGGLYLLLFGCALHLWNGVKVKK